MFDNKSRIGDTFRELERTSTTKMILVSGGSGGSVGSFATGLESLQLTETKRLKLNK